MEQSFVYLVYFITFVACPAIAGFAITTLFYLVAAI